jgi:hypothetical protein
MVAHMQSKGFPNLQPGRAAASLKAQARCSPLAKTVVMLMPGSPIDSAKDTESIGNSRLKMFEVIVQYLFSPATIQVNIQAHAGLIQHIQQF